MLTDLLKQMGFTPPQQDRDKPLLGASACLLGENVRYDGQHKRYPRLINELGPLVRLRPLCPETAIGLPVPRPAIQVRREGDNLRVRQVDSPGRDYRGALAGVAETLESELSGFVLKAHSPSCGYLSTPYHDTRGQETGMASGAFAHRLHQLYPRIPLANDTDLEKPAFLHTFVLSLYCYHHWQINELQGQWLERTLAACEGLPDPLYSNLRIFLARLGKAMH